MPKTALPLGGVGDGDGVGVGDGVAAVDLISEGQAANISVGLSLPGLHPII